MENTPHDTVEISNNNANDSQIHQTAAVPYRRVTFAGIALGAVFGIALAAGALLCFSRWHDIRTMPLARFMSPLWSDRSEKNAHENDRKIQTDPTNDPVVAVVDKASPAVVSIVITQDVPKIQGMGSNNPFGFPFFMMPQNGQGNVPDEGGAVTEKQTVGQGSGFFVSADGLIVTNRHVVSASSADYTVIASDGKEYPAKVLARDTNRDIAILKVDASDVSFLELGDSDAVKVGQTVLAIGNSLGEFSNTVSKGIVSGLRRNLVAGSGMGSSGERLSNIIQTDAAINPGNSGGPLLDISGKVIGVNVAMAQGAQSIGFALPSNQIRRIIDQVQATGKITQAFLGVRYIMLTPALQKENSLPLDHGALILRGDKMTDFAVVPGSPADKAGLMENDIMLEVDGVAIDESHQVSDLVSDRKPGDTLNLTIWHKGETKTVTVVLEEKK